MAAAGIVLLAAAAVALIASIGSIAVAFVVRASSRRLEAVAPAAQARVLLTAALLPMFVSVTVVATALAPALGLIADHCLSLEVAHQHPHLCTTHHEVALPAASVILLATYLGVRLTHRLGTLALRCMQALRSRLALDAVSSEAQPGVRVLRMDEPQAFVLGLFHSTIYVTDGLARAEEGAYLEIALAHERAHLERRDPLVKAIASFGLAFHLPGIASWLARQLVRAQEMAADEGSADRTGSRAKVAEALVRLARVRACVPIAATAFGTGDLEARVSSLLSRERPNSPPARVLVAAALAIIVCTAINADPVHHAVEILLGFVQ